MRFLKRESSLPPNGKLDTSSWFAILPVTVNDEIRWMETVTVEYEYWEGYGAFAAPCWIATKFVDKPMEELNQ